MLLLKSLLEFLSALDLDTGKLVKEPVKWRILIRAVDIDIFLVPVIDRAISAIWLGIHFFLLSKSLKFLVGFLGELILTELIDCEKMNCYLCCVWNEILLLELAFLVKDLQGLSELCQFDLIVLVKEVVEPVFVLDLFFFELFSTFFLETFV